jgi:hypothetical protein
MACNGLFHCYWIELFAIGEDDDIIYPTVITPVEWACRVRFVQISSRPFGQIRKGVEWNLKTRVFTVFAVFAAYDKLVDVLLPCYRTPLCADKLMIEDKILPELRIRLVI